MAAFNSADFLTSADFNTTVDGLIQGKVYNWINDVNWSFVLSA
jgi:hypothetical protein